MLDGAGNTLNWSTLPTYATIGKRIETMQSKKCPVCGSPTFFANIDDVDMVLCEGCKWKRRTGFTMQDIQDPLIKLNRMLERVKPIDEQIKELEDRKWLLLSEMANINDQLKKE